MAGDKFKIEFEAPPGCSMVTVLLIGVGFAVFLVLKGGADWRAATILVILFWYSACKLGKVDMLTSKDVTMIRSVMSLKFLQPNALEPSSDASDNIDRQTDEEKTNG